MTTDSIDSLDLFLIGPRIENHEAFQGRVNAEFAEVISRREIRMRVWERGSGETMTCGTGAVAVAAAGYISGKLDTEVKVHLNGGDLDISYDPDSGHWYMTGTAEEVFEGTITGEPHETERPE